MIQRGFMDAKENHLAFRRRLRSRGVQKCQKNVFSAFHFYTDATQIAKHLKSRKKGSKINAKYRHICIDCYSKSNVKMLSIKYKIKIRFVVQWRVFHCSYIEANVLF